MQVDDSPALRAFLKELRALCAKLPGAEEYVMVHHPAFRVGKKPFVIAGMHGAGAKATLSVNLGRDEQPILLSDPRFERTGYIGQHGWVTAARAQLSHAELQTLVTDSWRRVASKRQLAQLAGTGSDEPGASKPSVAKRKAVKRKAVKQKAVKRKAVTRKR